MKVKVRCPACGARAERRRRPPPETACPGCGGAIPLAWTAAVGEDREVDACPVCEGRDFYVRKDLNRNLGLAAVVVVGLVSVASCGPAARAWPTGSWAPSPSSTS